MPVNPAAFDGIADNVLEESVVGRFFKTARSHQGRLATSDVNQSLDYAALWVQAQRVAAWILQTKTADTAPIAILLRHEARYPAAMLGILAARRPYVPLDADHPPARNRRIAEHAGASAIVSAGELVQVARTLFGSSLPVMDMDCDNVADAVRIEPAGLDDLAYITYTSGSTGQPKGVYQNNRGLLHDLHQFTDTLGISAEDRLCMLYSPSLLVGARIALTALLNGASAHMLSARDSDLESIVKELQSRRITVLRTVPTLFRRIVGALAPGEKLDSLRWVYLGGDRVGWKDYDAFRHGCNADAQFGVHLSSTECTTFLQWRVEETRRSDDPLIPVGYAVPDRIAEVRDEKGQVAPDGSIGEITVTSRYIALGYWNDPEMTAHAFARDPSDSSVRIFHSGDLGRRRPDGLFEFLGRKDHQVKISGQRVEPAEIEAALESLSCIRDAAVLVRRDASGIPRTLAAYVEPAPGIRGLLPRHVINLASRVLPSHMVPATVYVGELPRMANFKPDRARIADMDTRQNTGEAERRHNPTLDAVAQVFEQVLDVPRATPEDNVRSLGGDSLLAVQISVALEKRFELRIPPEEFETLHSIRALAQWIDGQKPGKTAFSGTPLPRYRTNDASDEQRETLACVAELRKALRENHAPALTKHAADAWVQALDFLMLSGRLDVAEFGARHLNAAEPKLVYAQNLSQLFDCMPKKVGIHGDFRDDSQKEMQIVRHADANTVVILFCDALHRMGLPLNAMHRWLGTLPASLIYLRDFSRTYYLAGIPSLGAGRTASLAALKDLCQSLDARRIVCCGDSAGGYGALLWGLEMGAAAVLSLGPATNMSVEFNVHLRTENSARRLRHTLPAEPVDLRSAYLRSPGAPKTNLVYSSADWDDRLHAEYMDGLPSVMLTAIPEGDEHNVIRTLIRLGRFAPLLEELMTATPQR